MSRYMEQLDRVRRWYKRFESIHHGRVFEGSPECLVDEIYAFFLNCYHLKDWLIKDTAYTAHTEKEVEDYIKQTTPLAICADICNATKHLVMNRSRSGMYSQLGGRHFAIGIGGPSQTISIQVDVIHGGQCLNAFDVATNALKAWEAFLGLALTHPAS